MWPSAQSWNWNSVDIGPERDIVGELAAAVRATGLDFGLYYSLYVYNRPYNFLSCYLLTSTGMNGTIHSILDRTPPNMLPKLCFLNFTTL